MPSKYILDPKKLELYKDRVKRVNDFILVVANSGREFLKSSSNRIAFFTIDIPVYNQELLYLHMNGLLDPDGIKGLPSGFTGGGTMAGLVKALSRYIITQKEVMPILEYWRDFGHFYNDEPEETSDLWGYGKAEYAKVLQAAKELLI